MPQTVHPSKLFNDNTALFLPSCRWSVPNAKGELQAYHAVAIYHLPHPCAA